jgi:hypothetical protein
VTPQQRQIVREALILANPWTWGCLGLATSWWLMLEATRPFTKGGDR